MRRERIVLAFFVDALGWEIARRHRPFESVAPHAYRQRTVLGYSCAAQPTILTGEMPSTHGHWGMFYRTERSELANLRPLRFVPPFVVHHRRFRNPLLRWHRRQSGFTGYYNFYRIPYGLFDRYDICEKNDIYAPGAFASGTPSIFDDLAAEGLPHRTWTWTTPLEESFAELEVALTTEPELRFVLLYTAFLDGFLHDHVGDEEAVAEAIARVERLVESAVERARETSGEVEVLVFSDHGMTATVGGCDVMGTIGSLELAHGSDYLAFYDSTMARFWFTHETARKEIVDALEGIDRGTILTDDDLKREGVYFEDGRFGELIFLMDPGTLVVPSYMGERGPRGMHGFTPDHEDSHAVLMSSLRLDPEPAHIRDTYTVMRRLVAA